jgi:hypothetical protein
MAGALTQLAISNANVYFYQQIEFSRQANQHIQTRNYFTTRALEANMQCFNNDRCSIARIGDLYTPTKILCYNCSEDFSINSISLLMDDNIVLKISDTTFLDFIGFTEDINIDGTTNKIYNLDKTKLFFPIKLVALQWSQISILITKTGSCNTIKLNGVHDFLNNEHRRDVYETEHKDLIKIITMGNIENYNSGQNIYLNMNNYTNGFILTNINPNIIKSIRFITIGHDRLYYQDKFEIIANTQRINDNTIYINLNNCNYIDDITNSSFNTSLIDEIKLLLVLDEGHSNINFKIGCYSNNIINISNGTYNRSLYTFDHDISVSYNRPVQERPDYRHTISETPDYRHSWQTHTKKLVGNTSCPVTYDEIGGDYICCHQCNNNFDSCIIEQWIKQHNTCPMCRTNWNNFTIYKNTIYEIDIV